MQIRIFHPTALIILVAALLSSCTTAEVHKTSGSLTGSSSRVKVTPATGALDSETLRWYRENGGNARIASAVETQLSNLPISKVGGRRFDIRVVSFRLRSTQQQFWAGILNGPDHITADIVELRNGKQTSTFRAHSTNNATMYAGLSAAGRLDDMAEKLAKALAEQLD